MQVERMRASDGQRRDRNLDRRVPGKTVHAAGGDKILRLACAAQDLQEDGDGRGLEWDTVDVEWSLAGVVLVHK